METGWETWRCSAWRQECYSGMLEPLLVLKGDPRMLERDFGQRHQVMRQGEIASNRKRVELGYILGINS